MKATDALLCQRCKVEDAVVISRKQNFCRKCFCSFFALKQRKQMMSDHYYQSIFKMLYKDKVRSAEEAEAQNLASKVMIPLSFGSSSLATLEVLNEVISEHKKLHHGKTGFSVEVVTVYDSLDDMNLKIDKIKELSGKRYLQNKDKIKFHLIDINSFFKNSKNFEILALQKNFDNKSIKLPHEELPDNYNYDTLMSEIQSKSSREDLAFFIKVHLAKKWALQNNCKAILWGNSMTRVADEVISSIVNGRGASLSQMLNSKDFDKEFNGQFKNLYPMKDILLSEVDAFLYLSGMENYTINYQVADTLLIHKLYDQSSEKNGKSIKNMTMKSLARDYFNDIEDDYSNVISTVVRTAEKLDEPKTDMNYEKQHCSICSQIIYSSPSRWLNTITELEGHPLETEEDLANFKKWEEQLNKDQHISNVDKMKDRINIEGRNIPLCYGCIILQNTSIKNPLVWPELNKSELENVLDEYVLTEDED